MDNVPPNFKKIEEVLFNTLDELIWNYPKANDKGRGRRKKRKLQVKPHDFSHMCIFSCAVHLCRGSH